MSAIGFIQAKKINVIEEAKKVVCEDVLLNFDSSNSISFDDASHNTLVLGTTGSGKTMSIALPSILQFMNKGYAGLIIDIKGNLRESVYALAKAAGREKDIVEFGTSSTATPLNLLAKIPHSEVLETIKSLTVDNFEGKSHNMDFHIKGVEQAASCGQLLSYIGAKVKNISANLSFISEMINDLNYSSALYQYFLDEIYDENDSEQREFVGKIESYHFHLLHYIKKADDKKEASKYLDQLNYCLDTVRAALNQFLCIPGIAEGFAHNSKTAGLDMENLILKNKIVVLRFEPDSGPIGARLSRTLIEAYYRSIYTLGVETLSKHPSFICLDEFQEVADLSTARFSDMKFISQAREFNAHFIASSQSASALLNYSVSKIQVDAFLNNCNNRIIFYSDDPYTQDVVSRIDRNVSAVQLKESEAFVSRYECKTRKHHHQCETVHNLYKNVCEVLANNKVGLAKSRRKRKVKKLQELLVLKLPQKQEQEQVSDLFDTSKNRNGIMGHNRENKARSLQGEEASSSQKTRQENSFSRRVHREFPKLFSLKDGKAKEINIPIGWEEVLANALKAYKKHGFNYTIESFYTSNGKLKVTIADESRGYSDRCEEMILNQLLQKTLNTCTLCGAYEEKKREMEINICQKCLEIHNLADEENSTSLDL